MHEVLVNRLGGLSLPRKRVVRLTDRPDMTLDVYRGRKTTMEQQQQIIMHCDGASYNFDNSRARAYCACSRCGWGLFGRFYSHLSFLSSFSLSLETARYRLKYCLKGPLNPKQPTNQHYALTSVKPSMLKHEIKNILNRFLVDDEILDPSAFIFL